MPGLKLNHFSKGVRVCLLQVPYTAAETNQQTTGGVSIYRLVSDLSRAPRQIHGRMGAGETAQTTNFQQSGGARPVCTLYTATATPKAEQDGDRMSPVRGEFPVRWIYAHIDGLVPELLTHWSYVFFALTHRYMGIGWTVRHEYKE